MGEEVPKVYRGNLVCRGCKEFKVLLERKDLLVPKEHLAHREQLEHRGYKVVKEFKAQ
jgi:hypothetical protein